jgi:hypothetical protein
MSTLPRVAESTREQIAREFDDLGPDACIAEILAHLRENNPEWLHMASKCAADVGDPERILGAFCMFYRILTTAPGAPAGLNPLPRVTAATRAAIVAEIDRSGTATFIDNALLELEGGNPELLQTAHYFASVNDNYAGVMQGFALLYTALVIQSSADRLTLH